MTQPAWDDEPDEHARDGQRLTLGRLKPGERFAYEFDFGDSWLHLCTWANASSTQKSNSGSSRPAPRRTGGGV